MLIEGKQAGLWKKAIWMWLTVISLPIGGFAQAPQLTFETHLVDLGPVPFSMEAVTGQFQYCNKSTDTLRILHVKTASCNTVRYSNSAIAPGDCGSIAFRYHATAISGFFQKQATVYLQNNETPMVLELRGKIIASEKQTSTKPSNQCP